MTALKDRLKALLAQAKGLRVDVALTRLAAACGVVAGLGALAGYVPGKAGVAVATAAAVAAALGPKMTQAAGFVRAAQDQEAPLKSVLPQIVATVLSAPKLIAQAKADAKAQAADLAAQAAREDKTQMAADVAGIVIDALNRTGSFQNGPQGLVATAILSDVAAAVDKTGGSQ